MGRARLRTASAPTPAQEDGKKGRVRPEAFADHYSQARLFYRSMDPAEQAHMASAIVFELSKVSIEHIRVTMMGNLRNVDEGLASRVADRARDGTAGGLRDRPRRSST